MAETTYIVVAKPGEPPDVVEVPVEEIDARGKAAGGGWLELVVSPMGKDRRNLCVWVDEEGTLKGLPLGHVVPTHWGGMVNLCGPIVVTDRDGEDTAGLSQEEAHLVASALDGQS